MPAAKKTSKKSVKKVKETKTPKKKVVKPRKKVAKKTVKVMKMASPTPSSKTKLAPIFLIVVSALIIFLGFSTYQSFFIKKSPVIAQVPSATNWKTFTSPKANYSFKYPAEWPLVNVPTFTECTGCIEEINFTPKYDVNSADNTIAVVLVFKDDQIKTLDDFKNVFVNGDETKVDQRDTMVGGEKAITFMLAGGVPPLPVREYVVVKNGFYYEIWLEDSIETNKDMDKNLMLFNTMLSTFKFD